MTEAENLWLLAVFSCRERPRDGDSGRMTTVCELDSFSGSIVDPLDISGNRLLSLEEKPSIALRSSLFLHAAEPSPRSAVCLNHFGSFEPRDCAI